MLKVAGMLAIVPFERVSEITAPPIGAAVFSVTVQVHEFPPVTEVGESDTFAMFADTTERTVETDAPLTVAVTVVVADPVTTPDTTLKLTEVFPPGTVTVAGTLAAAVFELVRLTTEPADGAATSSFTVPTVVFPPVTVLGLKEMLAACGARIVRAAVPTLEPRVAEIVVVVV